MQPPSDTASASTATRPARSSSRATGRRSCCCTAGPLGRHLAAAAGRAGRGDRRAIAVDLPGFGHASRLGSGAILPQLDAFAGALVGQWAGAGEVVVVGNSLGGVTALRLAERADLPGGIVPVAPAGLQMPRWFEIVDRDPVVRRLLALPLPIAPAVLRATVGEVYRQLVFARPRAAEAAVVASFAAHHASREGVAALLASGRRLLPELATPPFDFDRIGIAYMVTAFVFFIIGGAMAEVIRAQLSNPPASCRATATTRCSPCTAA